MAEVIVNNEAFYGKSLDEMDFRNRYHVNVILVVNAQDEINQMPRGTDKIQQGDRITVVGPLDAIEKLNDLLKK